MYPGIKEFLLIDSNQEMHDCLPDISLIVTSEWAHIRDIKTTSDQNREETGCEFGRCSQLVEMKLSR